MFKIFKPYMLLLLILLTSSSIAMAQDCSDGSPCQYPYMCENGDCVPDVNLDRDVDGVPDAGDNCPDVPNTGQEDWDLDGIGWFCDDDGDGPNKYFLGYIRRFPDHSERSQPLSNQNLFIKINDLDFQEIITDEDGQINFNYTIQPPRLELLERDCVYDSDCNIVYECIARECVPNVDLDRDRDGVPDAVDNCPDEGNPPQKDSDFDGIGDACDEEVEMKELRLELYTSEFEEPIKSMLINIENNRNAVRLETIFLQRPSCYNIDCFNQELLEYFGIGDYDNALLTAMKSVEFADNNFKGLDAQMALAYNNLGFVYFKMDNPEEAERAYIQALQIWEETLGSDHPNVGASLNNLAALYEKAGGYKQAEEYRKRSKEIWQKAQEEASADICDSMTELLFDCPTDNNNGDEPIFDDIDNDRDGCINEDEFKTIQDIMTRLEVDPSDMTTNEELLLFNDIDENDDGCISKEEFHKAIDEN